MYISYVCVSAAFWYLKIWVKWHLLYDYFDEENHLFTKLALNWPIVSQPTIALAVLFNDVRPLAQLLWNIE